MTIINAFQTILVDLMELHSKRKPTKIWVDKGSAFCSSSFKTLLKDCNWTQTQNHLIQVQLQSLKLQISHQEVRARSFLIFRQL